MWRALSETENVEVSKHELRWWAGILSDGIAQQDRANCGAFFAPMAGEMSPARVLLSEMRDALGELD